MKEKNPYTEILKRVTILRSIYHKLSKYDEDDILFHSYGSDYFIRLTINNLDDLHKARKLAKVYYPNWKDELKKIEVPFGTECWTTWEDKNNPYIVITYKTKIDNFPLEKILPGKNCRFVTTTEEKPNSYISLVCEEPINEATT